ncbi:hypothetical protein QQX98_011239 [Neonectria punicea]|uniref:RRM domain-containing protein n=1 Tax=Neonectria punicea TaxID=979145 RepID=A0ABR1GMN5_9HYPO
MNLENQLRRHLSNCINQGNASRYANPGLQNDPGALGSAIFAANETRTLRESPFPRPADSSPAHDSGLLMQSFNGNQFQQNSLFLPSRPPSTGFFASASAMGAPLSPQLPPSPRQRRGAISFPSQPPTPENLSPFYGLPPSVAHVLNQEVQKASVNKPLSTTQKTAQLAIPATLPTRVSGFRPMAAVARTRPASIVNTGRSLIQAAASNFSSNYRGEHSVRNASDADLKPEENCSLWLTNLPPDVTYHELLTPIRSIGRIRASFINAPDYLQHNTAAGKVVFFSPGPAQNFLTWSLINGLTIRGHQIRVTHNRIKAKEEAIVADESRVLIITGHADFVNEKSLRDFFTARFIFQTDEVTTLIKAGDRAVVEYKFGSYRCQAQMGKMALEKDRPEELEKVEFGKDPCEVGETLSSYGVAGERIQGRGI